MALGDFTEQAESYQRSRPGYPEALVTRLLEEAGFGTKPRDRVVEIGAGTGLFTEELVREGFSVLAIEPNEAMRSKAKPHPRVEWREGTFEETGLEESAASWVVAAQAFHWADPPRALPEIFRILEPGGKFTVLWNCREYDRCEHLAVTREIILRRVPEFTGVYRGIDWGSILGSTGHFSEVVETSEPNPISMTRERYLGVWRSHHRLANIAGELRFSEILREVEAYLIDNGVDSFEVPYLCRAWTARTVKQSGLEGKGKA